MHVKNNLIWKKGLILLLLTMMVSSLIIGIPSSVFANEESKASLPDTISLEEAKELMAPLIDEGAKVSSEEQQLMSSDVDLNQFLGDNTNDYHQTFQPWKSQAAVRCITISDDYEYMAVGGGYLYDNEVQVYRWNPDINQYAKVWVSGDTAIKGDVTDIDFGDTDNNDFLEIVASSADGYFYVFEQQHIYDPVTNTENMFELVYTSPYLGQVWSVEVNDTDLDHLEDIIVVSWDYKVHVFEYWLHSGYPFNSEHWITYREKWTSHNLGQHPTSLVVGDTNYNGLPDLVVGTREGGIFIFENNGTILDINGQPYPLVQDNSYELIYSDFENIWRPIYSMDIGNLDNSPGDEVVIASFAFNGYILRYNDFKGYYLQKLIKDFESWTLKDFYPADHYVDNGTAGQNVYFQDSYYTGTTVAEPILQSDPAFIKGNYPYNTGAAQDNDTCYTYFESNATHSAWEVYDFGADEEGTGNSNDEPDIIIKMKLGSLDLINKDDLIISISPDYEHWVEVDQNLMSTYGYLSVTKYLKIDVDPILISNKWNYFRYINITVVSNSTLNYRVISIELPFVYQTVSTALSAEVGTLITGTSVSDEEIHALLGTVDGRIVAFKYNETSDSFVLSWDSWVDDRFTMGINIWDLEQVKTSGAMPMIYGYTDPGTTTYRGYFTNQPIDSIPGQIADYILFNIDGDSPATGEFIIADSSGDVYYFDKGLNYDAAQTTQYFTNINSYTTYTSNISISAAEVDIDYANPEILIGYYDPSISNVYDDFYDDSSTEIAADVHLWGQSSGEYVYINSLSDLETTGQLKEIMKNAQSVPSTAGKDIDGDGDTDIVICIDNLYLLWNIGDNADPEFVIDEEYFEDVNAVQGRRKFFHPQFVEFDHDGDFDLSIGYSNRVGATYFDNYGTAKSPKWEEKKELVNNFDEEATINVYNFTRPLWVSYFEYDEFFALNMENIYGKDYDSRYFFFTMIDDKTGKMGYFLISYSVQTSYMVAANPKVARVEVNTFKSEIVGSLQKRNFGFRAIESWSTAIDLYNWTLTVDTGDLDQDGKGELIIGDYDSNVYIFEHMTNNTYKRAFRSPDMLQFIATDETPYAWDQFGGYSGIFNQTFWNHVSYLVVNADSDGDGFLELAALAGTVLYVFEDTGVDDTYSLMFRFDLLRNVEADYMNEYEYLTPSGLTWAKDLDLDGYGEFILAFDSQVFVYEPYSGKLYELFGNVAISDPLPGHYNLPGNGKVYPQVKISGILCSDVNENGKDELFIYGSYDQATINDPGYLVMIESADLGYQIVWQGPDELVGGNKIYSIELGDQDYDGLKELVIGGEKGVSIWEFDGSETVVSFKNIGVITGHMNYPIMPAYSLFGENNYSTDSDFRLQRSHDVIQILHDNGSGENHSFIAVYSQYYNTGTTTIKALYQKVSHDGINWHSEKLIPLSSLYSHVFPSLTQTLNGSLWLAFTFKLGNSGSGSIYVIALYRSDDYGATWITVGGLTPLTTLEGGNPFRSPAIFPTGTNSIGLVYVYKYNSSYSEVYYGGIDKDGSTILTPTRLEGFDDFYINGLDAASRPDLSGNYSIVLSGKKYVEDKDDFDLWYAEVNATYNITLEPRKLFDSSSVEHTPSITYTYSSTKSRLVTFDTSGLKKAMTLSYGLVSDDGIHWSEPEIIAEYPDYVTPPTDDEPYHQFTYKAWPAWMISDVGFRAPKVAATYDGKFVVLTKFDVTGVEYTIPINIYYWNDYLCQVYSLNYTSFTALNKATDIAIGDSDRDGRKEILVADGNQAKMFEIISTADQRHLYSSKWYSPEHDNPVSDVSIYDTNGNKFPELVYSVQGEDVYVYEVTDIHMPISDIQKFVSTGTVSFTDAGEVVKIIETDLNSDEINDMVIYYYNRTTYEGRVFGILGNNLTVLWSFVDKEDTNTFFIEESIYNNQAAILVVLYNGTTFWLDKFTGETLHSFVIPDGNLLLYVGTTMNATKDGTMDIVIAADTPGKIYIYDGNNGSTISNLSYNSTMGIKEIKIAQSDGEDYIIVSYAWVEWVKPFLLAIYNYIIGYNMTHELWSTYINYASILGSKLLVEDVDGDGDSEVYIVGGNVKLMEANGTEVWSAFTYYFSNDAVVYDTNNDGIKDIIISSGRNGKITALDGTDGNITWANVPTKYSSGITDLVLSNPEGTNSILYATIVVGDYTGVIALNANNGGFYSYYAISDSSFMYGNSLVASEKEGTSVVLAAPWGMEKVYQLQFSKPEELYTHEIIDRLPFDLMNNEKGKIITDTIIYDDFDFDGSVDLFYVRDGNESIIYSPEKGEISKKLIIPTNNSVLYAIAADLPGYSETIKSIYIITSDYKIGILNLEKMEYVEILDKSGAFDDIASVATVGTTDGDLLIIGYHEYYKNWYISAWDQKGTEVFANPIDYGTKRPDQIITGPLLDKEGTDANLIVITSYGRILEAYYPSGTLYDQIRSDGDIGYTELGYYSSDVNHLMVYYRYSEAIICYSLQDNGIRWNDALENAEEVLSITTAFIPGTENEKYAKVFVSQNGTGLYSFDGLNKRLWYHNHNSFATKYLHVVNDTDVGVVLQATDYHRTFYIDPAKATVISATRNLFRQVLWVGTWSSNLCRKVNKT